MLLNYNNQKCKSINRNKKYERKNYFNSIDLIDLCEKYEQKLTTIENLELKKDHLKNELALAESTFQKISNEVNELRTKVCEKINQSIQTTLNDIMIYDIKLEFKLNKLSKNKWSESGDVEIKIDNNRNFSGGEISRIFLAIKIATATLNLPIIFDEIDIGVGGATAYKIGQKLKELAKFGQIIVVTHQPQVAACGSNHILVQKNKEHMVAKTLSRQEKIDEIARMISGTTTTHESLMAAEKLIEEVNV